MAEPSVSSQERGRRIRELLNNPLITRFKLIIALVFVVFLVLYLFLSLVLNNKSSLTNQDPSTTLRNERMLSLLERALREVGNVVLPMPLAIVGQSLNSNGTKKTQEFA